MSIAVAYIPTEAGERALTEAIARAARAGQDLVILNIHRSDRPGDDRHATAEDLAAAEARASERGVQARTSCIQAAGRDELVSALLGAVREDAPEVLVIGSRTLSPVPTPTMGLTMQQIVADAPCSVLVV